MHTTLIEVTSRESLLRVQTITSRFFETIYFPFSIQTQLEQSFPESPVRVFCHPSLANPKYFFMFKNNAYIKPYVAIAQVPDTSIDRVELIEVIREFRTRVFGAKRQPHLVIAKELLIKMYGIVMRIDSSGLVNHDLNLSLFYMTENQKKMAIVAQPPKLPPGYFFDEIDPTEEAEQVNNTWSHAGPGDLEQTMAKLVRLPSSCIRHDGQLVAFEMVDPAGFFNHQYVFEDHRRKGLGNAVELDLIKKAVKAGHSPFKTVVKENKIVLDASIASRLWTQWVDDEGKPETIVFQTWTNSP